MASPNVTVNPEDLRILRELARRKLDAVAHPCPSAISWLPHRFPLTYGSRSAPAAGLPASVARAWTVTGRPMPTRPCAALIVTSSGAA